MSETRPGPRWTLDALTPRLKLKNGTVEWPWGPVTRVHRIGEYEIVEYIGGANGETTYHPFISGDDTCHCYPTLDGALVGAIAYKRDGCNSQAATFFMRMIGAEK